MHEHFICGQQIERQIHVAGFEPILERLVAGLHTSGYAETTVSFYSQGAIHFAFWAARQHLGPSQIDRTHIAGFLSRHLSRCRCPLGGVRQHKTVRAALGHFGNVLREAGYAPWHPQEAPDAIDLQIDRFDNYLRTTAGLQEATREYRRRYAREFLKEFFHDRNTIDVSRLMPGDVVGYLSKRTSGLRPASAKVLATSLRSYLRFLRLSGDCGEALIQAVPAPASWRLASLPSVLADEEVKRLLAVFDRKTESGLRDYAMTRCLLDLGLRAQEVARLSLDDLDWRSGKLRIVGSKSRRDDELPLTAAVGGAIAAYIRRGRPETAARQIFVRLRPPVGQRITSRTVCGVIVRAAVRAELDATVHGPRILRHTAASRMVRHGARIKDVADVLRHRSLDTTAIYTKVDLPHLAAVAMPWPQKGEL